MFRILVLSLCLLLPALAQDKKAEEEAKSKDPMQSATFAGLKLRSIGPGLASGRIAAFAVNPKNKAHYYVGVASGGVWKTENAGGSWTPLFDGEGSFSIGHIAMEPGNPSVLWVGTGENNSQRSVAYGDGVYVTRDGGKSWQNVGLKKSEHIGRILIHPKDPNVVYVAAQGPLWAPGGDRGLYKTTDGGKTWEKVLSISDNTGVTDVVMDPSNPEILLAASYQRRRHVWTLINGGPESALHKSTDGGKTWRKVTRGLPETEMGRIGLAWSLAQPHLVYARVEAAEGKGGVFRSLDGGESWEKRNDFDQGAMYYGEIVADPSIADRIYLVDTYTRLSEDGGKTLTRLGERFKHVDTHAIWIDPTNSNYMLFGCDGGIYETFDQGKTYLFKANLPITQYYDVTVDNAEPFYNVYGGTQDNNTHGGPSRTRNAMGIANSDWFVTVGGDGFQVRVDPNDPNIVYSEWQYGGLTRFDRATGQRMGIKPIEGKGEAPYRWNWDSPLLLSAHKPTRLYFAANKVFRSDDRGDHWTVISPDLTRQVDRNQLPVMGKIWPPEAVAKNQSTSIYSNITALAESPREEKLLYAGTDDGLVQITEDGGANWRKMESFANVPKHTFVARLLASQHDANVVYAVMNNHKNGDFKPYLVKSADRGKTWKSIAGNLPDNHPLWAVAEDHVNPNLLFVGSEFGLFFTVDGGEKWIQLKSGLPTIAVRDLAIQKRENDLALATFGRGFYILDDYSPLRAIAKPLFEKESHLFPVKNPYLYVEAEPLGDRGRASQGEAFYLAENPPFGAVFTIYLKEDYKTKAKARQEAWKEAEKEKKPLPPYPDVKSLSLETREEEPALVLTITNSAGELVRRLTAPAKKGIQRLAWDLRAPAIVLPQEVTEEMRRINPDYTGPRGFYVTPGQYKVTLAKRIDGVLTPLGEEQTFTVRPDPFRGSIPSDIERLSQFQRNLTRLARATNAAIDIGNTTKSRLAALRKALQESTAPASLRERAAALWNQTEDLLIVLRGDPEIAKRQEGQPPSIGERIGNIEDEQSLTTQPPTGTHEQSYAIAAADFTETLAKLKQLVETDLRQLEREVEATDAPYTPGRMPEWPTASRLAP